MARQVLNLKLIGKANHRWSNSPSPLLYGENRSKKAHSAFLPSLLPSAILIFLMQSSKRSSKSTSSMESSQTIPAPLSRCPGTQWNSTKNRVVGKLRLWCQTCNQPRRPSLLDVWPGAWPLWASISTSEKWDQEPDCENKMRSCLARSS